MTTYVTAENEVDAIISFLKCKLGTNCFSTKQFFGARFNTLKDLLFGDLIIEDKKGQPILVDAKRNGWVSENSINNFAGDYYLFYYSGESFNEIQFVEKHVVKSYYEKVVNKTMMPISGEHGFCFKKNQLRKIISLEKFMESL